jgi:hypothetical protein
MAYLFYVLGWLSVLAGGAWLAVVVTAASRSSALAGGDQYASAGAMLGLLAVGTPALGVLFGGLILLAIGGGLARLDGILRHSRRTARVLDDMQRAAGGGEPN